MTATLLRLAAVLSLLAAGCAAAVQYSSSNWPATEAEVVRSGWSRDSGMRGTKGVYEVHYEYQVDGKNYANDRVSFSDNISLVHVIKTYQGDGTNVLRSAHPGDIVRVHYAPWWHAVSVLVPGPSPTLWIWCVVAGLFAVICLVFAKLSTHPVF
jgi:hypothetical protein